MAAGPFDPSSRERRQQDGNLPGERDEAQDPIIERHFLVDEPRVATSVIQVPKSDSP